MWPFSSRTPRAPRPPDPINELCRLLTERYYEWEASDEIVGSGRGRFVVYYLNHVSGAGVAWTDFATWVGGKGIGWTTLSPYDGGRLLAGVRSHAAARAAEPRRALGPTARLLAEQVLAGDEVDVNAARALADWIVEFVVHTEGAGG